MSPVIIRPGREDDLPVLTELYNHYVTTTPVTFDVEPWSLEERGEWFSQFDVSGRYQCFVAEWEGRVCGYACAGRFHHKKAYETSVEMSIYLAPDFHGKGAGSLLYGELFDALAGEDVHRAYASITQPNAASNALHRKFGFESVGLFREVGRKFGQYWVVEFFEKDMG
ncbi:MAG: N-acetyltransferase family protein [Candidatus Sumerlaeota bacterium]